MSVLDTHHPYRHFTRSSRLLADNRDFTSRATAMTRGTSDWVTSKVSVQSIFSYLLVIVSAAVLLSTGQPPWFLVPVAVALVAAFLLPKRLEVETKISRL